MTWRCGACGAQWSPGAPRCPECPSTAHVEVDEVLKISRDGQVTDSAAVPKPFFERLADVEAAVAEANAEGGAGPEVTATEAPEPAEPAAVDDGPTAEPPHAPVAPPRRPPRSAGA